MRGKSPKAVTDRSGFRRARVAPAALGPPWDMGMLPRVRVEEAAALMQQGQSASRPCYAGYEPTACHREITPESVVTFVTLSRARSSGRRRSAGLNRRRVRGRRRRFRVWILTS